MAARLRCCGAPASVASACSSARADDTAAQQRHRRHVSAHLAALLGDLGVVQVLRQVDKKAAAAAVQAPARRGHRVEHQQPHSTFGARQHALWRHGAAADNSSQQQPAAVLGDGAGRRGCWLERGCTRDGCRGQAHRQAGGRRTCCAGPCLQVGCRQLVQGMPSLTLPPPACCSACAVAHAHAGERRAGRRVGCQMKQHAGHRGEACMP